MSLFELFSVKTYEGLVMSKATLRFSLLEAGRGCDKEGIFPN